MSTRRGKCLAQRFGPWFAFPILGGMRFPENWEKGELLRMSR